MMTKQWLLWLAINCVIAGYFAFGLLAPASSLPSPSMKRAWLPGETTHGHYQIELECNACHNPAEGASELTSSDVMQDACIRCHGEQLKRAKDTHPSKKFRDPTHADLLLTLDAQNCLTCHREHVPDQTLEMGLTMPADYCWHCHQEVGENRPSHAGMKYDSCATAGCHNYHDNRALYEKFLNDHYGEPDMIEDGQVPARQIGQLVALIQRLSTEEWDGKTLTSVDADAPEAVELDDRWMSDWAETAHAAAGVNCTLCHGEGTEDQPWSDEVSMDRCGQCHGQQVETFLKGKHGMRLSVGLSPMTPSVARLPMHAGVAHAELQCNACHEGHRFDTQYAAVQACLKCHADDHSLAYANSSHAAAWNAELEGAAPSGSGVSCATCHLPRLEGDEGIFVSHDQNASLRPNETMAREVCLNCHSLEYSLSSLADPHSKDSCFGSQPEETIDSVEMAHDWFEKQDAKRRARQAKKSKQANATAP